jgi:predicted nucleotidyltransferase
MSNIEVLSEGRREVFRALVGSYNYNLNTETSDKDYKIFVLPTFDDLYFNKMFSKMEIGELEDYDIHDIRKLNSLLWKTNINFAEVLFSDEIVINDEDSKNYEGYSPTTELVQTIFSLKNELIKMNLQYLWNASVGMHIRKKSAMHKATSGTVDLVEKYGYDTKQAMHSLRVLYVLQRFADNDFKDFKKAIWFDNNDPQRKELLDIKKGKYTYDEMVEILDKELEYTKEHYGKIYEKQKEIKEINEILLSVVKGIVKLGLK